MPEPLTPDLNNSAWVRYRAVAYLRQKGLSAYLGGGPVLPKEAGDLGKYSLTVDVMRYAPHGHPAGVDVIDNDLSWIKPASLNHVFVGPRLLTSKDPAASLKLLHEKLQLGGHLLLHLSTTISAEDLHKWVSPYGMWKQKDYQQRHGQTFLALKLLNRSAQGVQIPVPSGKKRACISRFGAIGDMIMITPLIRRLAEDGYEVTLNITPYSQDVVKHNPYVYNVVCQERDAIPNSELGQYWGEWEAEYDRYINLSESVEGSLLKVEGRRDFYTSKQWRQQMCGSTNYYDQTMRLGGYPEATGCTGELYFSTAERKQAKYLREKYKDRFLVVWGLGGSSHHKNYPLLQPVLTQWLSHHPSALVVLVGGQVEQQYQFEHPQVVPLAGQVPIREVFALCEVADLVVGPESAIINAASCFPTPHKVVLLSHSSEDNLCKYWTNYTALAPLNIPCYPCHQLHYTKESCPLVSIESTSTNLPIWKGPLCAGVGVQPDRLIAVLDQLIGKPAAQPQLV